jgi:hypothetical protein
MAKKILPIVHLVDTEGPLNETMEATFDSLHRLFGIKLDPTAANLQMIQRGENVPAEHAAAIMKKYSAHRMSYNRSWADIDRMCETLFSPQWRGRFRDSFGGSYAINWCCVDFLGFDENPRQRQLGPNHAHRYYSNWVEKAGMAQDRLYWHYHPVSFDRAAHHSGTSLNHFPLHYTSLCHRILDCLDFPAVFRPGYHTERTDLNLFLEQWIPFDYGNQNVSGRQESTNYGRFQNWDGAPVDWSVYRPDVRDPRKKGALQRRIARCLNIGTDFSVINEQETELAFRNAAEGLPVIMSYADHDERNMVPEIEGVVSIIENVAKKYASTVDFKYCNAVEAMRLCEGIHSTGPLVLDIKLQGDRLEVKTSKKVFGSQPFLALRDRKGAVFHDNFCFGPDEKSFFYIFDDDSMPLNQLAEVGVGTNDTEGGGAVWVMNTATGKVIQKNWV